MGWILIILIGILAGYLASLIMKGRGLGLIWNLIVGLVGSLIGGWVFDSLGIYGHGLIWQIISATVGAIILLAIASAIKGK
jgi:uncharacterized membrane protein YeaQ/YmgE (transglycosylase-associated protein family)